MNHTILSDGELERALTNMSSDEVPNFVTDCVRTKRLNSIVRNLNHNLLFGTAKQRAEAKACLTKLGFV